GSVRRSERTTLPESASTISALPSSTSRSARRMGTMVRGSKLALSAKQPTITPLLLLSKKFPPRTPGREPVDPIRPLPGGHRLWYHCEPSVLVFDLARGDTQETILDRARHGARPSLSHRDTIHGTHRSDLRGRATEEYLVRYIEQLPRERFGAHFVPQ